MTFEYMALAKIQDKVGHRWHFGNEDMKWADDTSLIHVLNQYGKDGWELTIKEERPNEYPMYILKRQVVENE